MPSHGLIGVIRLQLGHMLIDTAVISTKGRAEVLALILAYLDHVILPYMHSSAVHALIMPYTL
jgi:hypothetical protein